MNLATGSATPPSTVMAIMPTRNLPPGAISDAGVVCAHATAVRPTTEAIERKNRRMCPPQRDRASHQYHATIANQTPGSLGSKATHSETYCRSPLLVGCALPGLPEKCP